MFEISLIFLVYVNSATVPNNGIINESTEILDENSFTKNVSNSIQECQTEVCLKESTRILNSMDQSVNPCENFYDFACGNLIKNTELPDDRNSQTEFTLTQRKVDKQVQTILTDEMQPNEIKPFKLAKIFIKTCMDEETLNKSGKKTWIKKNKNQIISLFHESFLKASNRWWNFWINMEVGLL